MESKDIEEYKDWLDHEGPMDLQMVECDNCYNDFMEWQLEAGVCESCAEVSSAIESLYG